MSARAGMVRVDTTGMVVVGGADVDAQDALEQLDAAVAGIPPGTPGAGELLMQDGVSNPPVPVETEDGTDWLYEG